MALTLTSKQKRFTLFPANYDLECATHEPRIASAGPKNGQDAVGRHSLQASRCCLHGVPKFSRPSRATSLSARGTPCSALLRLSQIQEGFWRIAAIRSGAFNPGQKTPCCSLGNGHCGLRPTHAGGTAESVPHRPSTEDSGGKGIPASFGTGDPF